MVSTGRNNKINYRNDIENALNNLEDSLQQNRGKSPYISKK